MGNFTRWRRAHAPQDFRGLIRLCVAVSGVILLANVALLAMASRFPVTDVGTRLLFEGDCNYTSSRSTIAHLGINSLATILLAASNVAMQCLAAPTRADLDRVHARGIWLDIGVPSLRNLRYSSGGGRLYAWIALLITSLPLHLVYNAIFIQSSPAAAYNALVVSQDFMHGAALSYQSNDFFVDMGGVPLNESSAIQKEVSTYTKLSWMDCQEVYAQPFVRDWTNLVIVTNITNGDTGPCNGSSLLTSWWYAPNLQNASNNFFLATGEPTSKLGTYGQELSLGALTGLGSTVQVVRNGSSLASYAWQEFLPNTAKTQPLPMVTLEYCLAKPALDTCTIELFEPFLGVIIGAIVLKMICFVAISYGLPGLVPLVTFGDAIASFLECPDATTVGGRAVSHERVNRSRHQIAQDVQVHGTVFATQRTDQDRWFPHPATWYRKSSLPWLHATSRPHRIITEVCCILLLIVGGWLFTQAAPTADSTAGTVVPTIQQLGLGELYPKQILSGTLTWTAWQCLLVANTPQLFLSFVYLFYNQYFTLMVAGAELFSFGKSRQRLRVSRPVGNQRSSYWLGLPFKWSVCLVLLSIGLHWAMSQTLFMALVRVVLDNPTESLGTRLTQSVIAYSYPGLIVLYGLAGLMIVSLFVVGFVGRYDFSTPLLGSNSIAISAACHGHYYDPMNGRETEEVNGDPRRPDDAEIAVRYSPPPIAEAGLKYGVTAIICEGHGIVGFSSGKVQPLQPGWVYGLRNPSDQSFYGDPRNDDGYYRGNEPHNEMMLKDPASTSTRRVSDTNAEVERISLMPKHAATLSTSLAPPSPLSSRRNSDTIQGSPAEIYGRDSYMSHASVSSMHSHADRTSYDRRSDISSSHFSIGNGYVNDGSGPAEMEAPVSLPTPSPLPPVRVWRAALAPGSSSLSGSRRQSYMPVPNNDAELSAGSQHARDHSAAAFEMDGSGIGRQSPLTPTTHRYE